MENRESDRGHKHQQYDKNPIDPEEAESDPEARTDEFENLHDGAAASR